MQLKKSQQSDKQTSVHGSCAADKRTAEQNLEVRPPVFLPNSLSSLTFAPFFLSDDELFTASRDHLRTDARDIK